MNLDLKDRKILNELDKNARISYSKIGKRIRLSKNSVINRIKKLEDKKIILGYNTIINVNSIGYTTHDVYLKFKNTNYEQEQNIIKSALANENIWMVAKVEGPINLSLLISTKTPEEFSRIWEEFYATIKPYVDVYRIAILLEYHHFRRKYLIDDPKHDIKIVGKRSNKTIDEKDNQILKIISTNARTSLLKLSQKLNMTTKTIAARIKRLEKEKIILGYRINLNFQKMGYIYYKMMVNLTSLDAQKRMYNFILSNEHVVYYDKFIGGHDFEFDLEVESFDVFLSFLETFKKEFGDDIQSYEYMNPTIIYKSEYFSG